MNRANAPQQSTSAAQKLLALLKGRPIVLVGMMGAGKTSVGRRLATQLGRGFIDSDHEIEAAAGITKEFFDKYFNGRDVAHALKINTTCHYETPMTLICIKKGSDLQS